MDRRTVLPFLTTLASYFTELVQMLGASIRVRPGGLTGMIAAGDLALEVAVGATTWRMSALESGRAAPFEHAGAGEAPNRRPDDTE
jgi:hypothetical protein